MLLYITTGEPRDREARPLHTIPDTVTELYYLAMREHARPGVFQQGERDAWVRAPDWRFDRQVIRVALALMNRLNVPPGARVAILGPLQPLWMQVDFAVQGMRAAPVGLADSLGDEDLVRALTESGARVAFGTDRASADRLLAIRNRLPGLEAVVVPESKAEGEDGVLGLDFLWDRGQVLDTPEHAQNWRSLARKATADEVALVHYTLGPTGRLVAETWSHGDVMAFVRDRVARCPARQGDVAYFEGSAVTPMVRLSYITFVGDGYTMVTLPAPGDGTAVGELQPAKLVASPAWLAGLAEDLTAVSGLGRARKLGELVRARVGERLRWIEPAGELSSEVEKGLLEAGLPLAVLPAEARTSS